MKPLPNIYKVNVCTDDFHLSGDNCLGTPVNVCSSSDLAEVYSQYNNLLNSGKIL